MTEAKHSFTPGPWIAQADPTNHLTGRDDWCIGIAGAPADYVAVCSERDAHVIAAAPAMYEALAASVPALDVLADVAQTVGVALHLPGLSRVIESARAALALARGEA